MQRFVYIAMLCFCFISCGTTYETFTNKRIVSNPSFREEFRVIDEDVKAKLNKTYFWFRAQEMHSSIGDYAGELIDGQYIKYYRSNQLAEKGTFDKGTKDGQWKSWYKNGNLKTHQHWKKGSLNGKSISLDSLGSVIAIGKYKKGKKTGTWIFPVKKDTIQYKKGKVVQEKIKDTTHKSFWKRLFKKKKKSSKKVKPNETQKKKRFFSRIFSKKNKQ